MAVTSELRRDIEGLRAFAVLAVVINHAFPRLLPGGFIGVDVFFVISGFLIGGHLIDGFRDRTLTLGGFFAKRVRRIFPALCLVLMAVWIGGSLILTGPEFAALGMHTLAGTTFSSNFLLASEAGYFDAPAWSKPLLHLWSLAVEEQFYLVAPFLVIVGMRFEGRPSAWFLRLGALSLLVTVWFHETASFSAFYLLHTRFWELAAGVLAAAPANAFFVGIEARHRWASRELQFWSLAVCFLCVLMLLAVGPLNDSDARVGYGCLALMLVLALAGFFAATKSLPLLRLVFHGRVTAAAGAALLLLGLLFASSRDWPGPATLLPVLGTALLLANRAGCRVQRLLACRPAVAVGQISYPLYLWHWPLLVAWRLLLPNSAWYGLMLPVACAFVLAVGTKLLVEDPARFGRLGRLQVGRPALGLLVSALFVPVGAGLLAQGTNGLPQRFSPTLQAMAEWSEGNVYDKWRAGTCYEHPKEVAAHPASCSPPKRQGTPLLLLWGDSHAGHLYPGLQDQARQLRVDVAQWTAARCPPTLHALKGESAVCETRRAAAWAALRTYTPDAVILGGAWGLYQQSEATQTEIEAAISETIRKLGRLGVGRVLVMGPAPYWAQPLPGDLFRHMVRHRLDRVPERFGVVSHEYRDLDAAIAKAARENGAVSVSLLQILCTNEGCRTSVESGNVRPDLTFWDRDHLTPAGSRLVLQQSAGALRQVLLPVGSEH